MGEETADTRRRVQRDELLTAKWETEAIEQVVQKLADAKVRLLTTHQTEVEIAHEALIQAWDRLDGWLNEDRESLLVHRRLTRAAQQWDSQLDRDPESLYRGVQLEQAEIWAAANQELLNPQETAFLTASQQQRTEEW